ncbi:MAG: hypothetical protein JO192_11880 [Candidatus Eremiobacteraeota bacterium]|nr:hypothetical protein [Candidatus Eremiobacteraeota bacterium]
MKHGSPMTPEMPPGKNAFNGDIIGVVIEATGESQDHLLSRDDVLNMIVARQ